MTLGAKPLTSKPGEFYARCKLPRSKPEKHLTPEELQEAKDNGYTRWLNRQLSKPRWEIKFPESCTDFETRDRNEFLTHMATEHGRKPGGPIQIALGKGNWRGPRLTEDGAPFVDRDSRTETCPKCGLVSEVPISNAGEVWWREHLDLCTGEIAETAVA